MTNDDLDRLLAALRTRDVFHVKPVDKKYLARHVIGIKARPGDYRNPVEHAVAVLSDGWEIDLKAVSIFEFQRMVPL